MMFELLQINLLVLQKGNARPREVKVPAKATCWGRAGEALPSSLGVRLSITSPLLRSPDANSRGQNSFCYFEMSSQAQQEFLIVI